MKTVKRRKRGRTEKIPWWLLAVLLAACDLGWSWSFDEVRTEGDIPYPMDSATLTWTGSSEDGTGRLLRVGGQLDGDLPLNTVSSLDWASKQWITWNSTLYEGRVGHSTVAWKDRAIALFGSSTSTPVVDILSPDSFSIVSVVPYDARSRMARQYQTAAVVNDRVIVFGGRSKHFPGGRNDIAVLEHTGTAWRWRVPQLASSEETIPAARYDHAMAMFIVRNQTWPSNTSTTISSVARTTVFRMVVVGGIAGERVVSDVFLLEGPAESLSGWTWRPLAMSGPHVPQAGMAFARSGALLVLIGGIRDHSRDQSHIIAHDIREEHTRVANAEGTIPDAHYRSAATTVSDDLIVFFGGVNPKTGRRTNKLMALTGIGKDRRYSDGVIVIVVIIGALVIALVVLITMWASDHHTGRPCCMRWFRCCRRRRRRRHRRGRERGGEAGEGSGPEAHPGAVELTVRPRVEERDPPDG